MHYNSALGELIDLLYGVFVYKEQADYSDYIPVILDTITELAVPTAAILLIIYLIRQLRKK